ncbi:E3 ubiquitin-protein ligase TRIM23, partial [Armadillidium vulgare]
MSNWNADLNFPLLYIVFTLISKPTKGFILLILSTKDNRIHIGTRIEMRVVTLGLDGAGKTSILFKLKNDEFVSTIPTIGFNVETIELNSSLLFGMFGGQPKLRPLWRHYYFNTQAVIFVIDATNVDRLLEAQSELNKLMTEKELKDASLLIFANKSGDPNALATSTLTETLGLQKLCLGRSWHLHPCDAQSGLGLQQGLD